MSKVIEILVGVPCSGKSTYCKPYEQYGSKIISRDNIRENSIYFNQPYEYSTSNENYVTTIYENLLKDAINDINTLIIILDNTHCKEKYINNIVTKYSKHTIKVIFFDISLWKAHYRNIIRYFKIRKWIPIKVMNNMYKNYKKINKQKYAKYMVH